MIDFHSIHGEAGFYFTRHGESEGNRAGIMQGRTPSTLTERGGEQARETGRWFRSRGIDIILSSPLARALQTAHIIGEEAGIPDVRSMEELTEIDTGIFSELTFDEARARFPDAWMEFQRLGWEGVPGAEKARSLAARAEAAWGRLFALFAENRRNILCVSHSGFLQWIIRSTLGLQTWMPLISTSGNCGITHLRVANAPLDGGGHSYYVNWTMINMPPSAAG
jgi:broad specificity phosphatase PhoE